MHYRYVNPAKLYQINGKKIESSSEDLGILIQEDLDWDVHVTKVTNQVLGMIRRSFEDESVEQAWRPCKQKHVDQIEKIQR